MPPGDDSTTNADLLKAMTDMRADVCGHLHTLDAKTDAQDAVMRTMADQVAALTEAKRENSMRAKSLSESDTSQASALAQEIAARRAVEEKVDRTEAKVDKIAQATQAQSDFMGVGLRGLKWLTSKEGRAAVAQIAIVVGVGYETLRKMGILK